MDERIQSLPEDAPAPQPRIRVISPQGEKGSMDAAEFPEWKAKGWRQYHPPGTVQPAYQGGALRSTLDAVGANSFQPVLTGLAGSTAVHLFGANDPEAQKGEGFWQTYNRFKHRQQRDSMEMDKESPSTRQGLKVAGDLGVQAALAATGVGPVAAVVGQSAADWGVSAPGDIMRDDGSFNPQAAGTALGRSATGAAVGAGGYATGKYVVGPAMQKVGGFLGQKADDVADAAYQQGMFGKGGGAKQKASALGSYRESLTEEKRVMERLFADEQLANQGMFPGQLENAVRTAARSNEVQQAAARSAAANIEQMPSKMSRPGIERAAYQAIDPDQIAQEIQKQLLAPSAGLKSVARFGGRFLAAPALGAATAGATDALTENAGLTTGAGIGVTAMFMRPGVRKAATNLLTAPSLKYNTLRIFQAALQRDPTMVGRIMGTTAMALLHPDDSPQEIAAADFALSQTEPAYRQAKREQGGGK